MRSNSRFTALSKGVHINIIPLGMLTIFFTVLFVFFYVPPANASLSFFGIYGGTINTFGVHWEHEWFAVGMLLALALVTPLVGTSKTWFISLAVIAAFLIISDITSIVAGNLFTNTAGVEASVMIGALMVVLAGGVITGGGKK